LQLQFGKSLGGRENRFGGFRDLARHLQQNAMDLGLFFIQQADQVVVLLDGFERLHEDGLPAGMAPWTTPCTRRSARLSPV